MMLQLLKHLLLKSLQKKIDQQLEELYRDLRLLDCTGQTVPDILQQKKISLHIPDSTVANKICALQAGGVEDQIQTIGRQKDYCSLVDLQLEPAKVKLLQYILQTYLFLNLTISDPLVQLEFI